MAWDPSQREALAKLLTSETSQLTDLDLTKTKLGVLGVQVRFTPGKFPSGVCVFFFLLVRFGFLKMGGRWGGGFKKFLFSPLFGEDSHVD